MYIPTFKWWDIFRGHRYHRTYWFSRDFSDWINKSYENVDTKVKSKKKRHKKRVQRALEQLQQKQ